MYEGGTVNVQSDSVKLSTRAFNELHCRLWIREWSVRRVPLRCKRRGFEYQRRLFESRISIRFYRHVIVRSK